MDFGYLSFCMWKLNYLYFTGVNCSIRTFTCENSMICTFTCENSTICFTCENSTICTFTWENSMICTFTCENSIICTFTCKTISSVLSPVKILRPTRQGMLLYTMQYNIVPYILPIQGNNSTIENNSSAPASFIIRYAWAVFFLATEFGPQTNTVVSVFSPNICLSVVSIFVLCLALINLFY